MACCFGACQDLDGIRSRLDDLDSSVNNLQSAVKAIQDAYSDGKIVTGVKPFSDANNGGWKISFSDNSDIIIPNGKDGIDAITPFLKIDAGGYWTISYDNGESFEALLDEEENKIKAIGIDGIDGIDGLSARPSIDAQGNYIIQFYRESEPTVIIREVKSEITSDSHNVLSSMTQDDRTHVITMNLADGTSYTFNQHLSLPKSISILSQKSLVLTSGAKASIEFRVNPSNAAISLDDVVLDKVGTTRSFNVNSPTAYKVLSLEQVYEGKTMKVGQYRVTIQDTKGQSAYNDQVALVLSIAGSGSSKMQISSSPFNVSRTDLKLNTGLPVVYINTPNSVAIDTKDDWLAGVNMMIVKPDNTIDYQGTLSMKGRGNSTWLLDKKPYALKLDTKESILGMKKHKRWCLLANYRDRTLMRNDIAFEIAKRTELAWTPSGEFVELVFNGKHVGSYYLCEQVKVDKNRVDVAELDPEVTSGEGITGGYLFELDTYYDEVYKFKAARTNFPWMFKDPDEVNTAQFNYVQNYVNAMEDALYSTTKFKNREFVNYMDLESFVDWWFVNELTMNDECKFPKSCYMNKDINGKMKAGPVWDFDAGTFMPSRANAFFGKESLYYPQLFRDSQFVSLVKTRWVKFKPSFLKDIPEIIEKRREKLKKSDAINIKMWPIRAMADNGDETMDFDAAVTRLKTSYLNKLSWLDAQIQAM